jgi:mRNA-degrading endonuclease RelE of RelBE toxin-antitoxin system
VRPRAQRQLARLPEKIAVAAAEFITGPLLDNPRRVGHPLRDEYAGQHSARRGPDWRVRYRIDQDSHTVVVLDVSHRSDTYGT